MKIRIFIRGKNNETYKLFKKLIRYSFYAVNDETMMSHFNSYYLDASSLKNVILLISKDNIIIDTVFINKCLITSTYKDIPEIISFTKLQSMCGNLFTINTLCSKKDIKKIHVKIERILNPSCK